MVEKISRQRLAKRNSAKFSMPWPVYPKIAINL
jgi:hypothetical protein